MKYKLLYICIAVLSAACQRDYLPMEVAKDDVLPLLPANVEKGHVYVKFSDLPQELNIVRTRSEEVETGNVELNSAVTKIGMTGMKRVFPYAGKFEARTKAEGLHLWYDVYFDKDVNVNEAVSTLSDVSVIERAEYITTPTSCSEPPCPFDDPLFNKQWYLSNDGSWWAGTAGNDINIQEAWEIEKGDSSVIVLVSDQLVDVHHEDLNIWKNPGEYGKDPDKDNDGNGYIGDWYGRRYNDKSGEPYGHGTNVAGIIGAINNNGKGVCGIAGGDYKNGRKGVRIMLGSMADPADIKYGADNGAVICNCSWHGGNKVLLQEAINYFVKYAGIDENGQQTGPMRGGMVIAAAGNDGTSAVEHCPGSLDNVIAVANLQYTYIKDPLSNYADWVDISAFGAQNFSTYYDRDKSPGTHNLYEEMGGTSQAAPVVSGVAALIVSKFGGAGSGLTPREVEQRLYATATSIDSYNPEYAGKLGAGCVNAAAALGDSINFVPRLFLDRQIAGRLFLTYGEEYPCTLTATDYEDGTIKKENVEISGSVDGLVEKWEINGEKITLTIANRNVSRPGSHSIVVKVKDSAGATASVTIPVKFEPELVKEVELPGTVVDELVVRASMNFSGSVTVEIFDMSGRQVLKETINISLSQAGSVDVSGLSGGCYMVKLTCNNKTIVKNIIKL